MLKVHPKDSEEVRASVERYGPYIVHNRKFVSLKAPDRKRGGSTRAVLKEMGTYPEDGDHVRVLDSRYGP